MSKLHIKWVVLGVSLATVILFASLTAASTQSLRSGAYFCGTDGSCQWYKAGSPDWVFQRFTYIMGYAECQNSIAEWKTKSPGCQLVVYTTGTDLPAYKTSTSNSYVFGRKSFYVRNRMTQLGELEEKAYMHFYNDTKLTNWNGTAFDTILIRGTNSMTIAAKDSVSRVPNSYVSYLFHSGNTYSGDTRLAPNFTNAKLRLAYKEFITQAFNSTRTTHWPSINGYWDGIYFDNYSPDGLRGNHLASGGLVVESGTSPANLLTFGSDAYAVWSWESMKAFGREVRDTLRTSDQWSEDHKKKTLAYNVGVSFENSYMYPDSTGADALNYEFAYDPVMCANNSFYRLENIFSRDSIATLHGETFFWCSRPRTDNTTKAQSIYDNLCFYYAARTDSTWIYMRPEPGNAYGVFLNTGFDTLAWIPAMGYDLGRPSGHYQLVTSGTSTDYAGATYKVWSRDYQGGKVLTRPKDHIDAAAWGSTSAPVTVSLGGSYKQVNIDGSLGPTITTIALRASEGAILVPAVAGQCTTPPTDPILNSPADSSTTASRTPTLCCNNSSQTGCTAPILYDFQVSTQVSFGTIAAENASVSQGASTTCWQVSPSLTPGVLYYWRVRASNGTSMSAWSATRKFVTPNSPPTVPVMSSPGSGSTVTTTQPSLVVQNSTDPDGTIPTYQYQVSLVLTFATITIEVASVTQGPSSTTWQIPTPLVNLLTYYWRVRAYDGVAYSGWATARSFNVNQPIVNNPPSVPVLSAPSAGATVTTRQPSLVIQNSTDPEGNPITYHYQVSLSSVFATIAVENTSVPQGSPTTSWQVSSVLNNQTTYYWRVRAYDGTAYSGWSTSRSFYVNQIVVNNPPTVPVLSTPAAGATVTSASPSLVIQNSTDPEGNPITYNFQVAPSSGFTVITAENPSVPSGQVTTTWQVSTTLSSLTTYYWRVRAYDGNSYSAWSTSRSFYVNIPAGNNPPTTPVCSSPLSGSRVTDLTPDLTITNSTDPNGDPITYQFELYDASFSTMLQQSPMIAQSGGGTTTWAVPGTLAQKTKYNWRVRAYDSQSWSGWMSLANFRTNRPPNEPVVPLTPVGSDTVVGSVQVLVTNNTSDPDGDTLTYDFRIFSDSLLTKQVEMGSSVPQGSSYTSYTTTATYVNRQPYWWRVRAFDGFAWCNWSTPERFTHLDMILDATDAPETILPISGAVEFNAQPDLVIEWSGVSGASVCHYELALDREFNGIIDGGSVICRENRATWNPTRPLENGKTYYWRARREGSGWSEASTFTLNANIFVSPNPFSYLDGELTLHNLPADSKFEVFTASGEKVIEIDHLDGNYVWEVRNQSGSKLASGVYLYYIKFDDKTVADKFVVVR